MEGFRDAYASKITWKEAKMAILNSSVVQNLEIISTVIVSLRRRRAGNTSVIEEERRRRAGNMSVFEEEGRRRAG